MPTFEREKARLNRSAIAVWSIAGIVFLLSSLSYIYPSIRATSLMYEYSHRVKRLDDLKELNKKLTLEAAALRSYDYIEGRAVTDLGFVFPKQEQVVIIAKK